MFNQKTESECEKIQIIVKINENKIFEKEKAVRKGLKNLSRNLFFLTQVSTQVCKPQSEMDRSSPTMR